jgi:hypothetical protein
MGLDGEENKANSKFTLSVVEWANFVPCWLMIGRNV